MIQLDLKAQEEKLDAARIQILERCEVTAQVSLAAPVDQIDARIETLIESVNDYCHARLCIGMIKRKEQREKWKQEREIIEHHVTDAEVKAGTTCGEIQRKYKKGNKPNE